MPLDPSGALPDHSAEWSEIVRFLRAVGADKLDYGYFAESVGIVWPKERMRDPIGRQLRHDWSEMLVLDETERSLLPLVFDNMRSIAIHLGWEPRPTEGTISSQTNAREWRSLVRFLKAAGVGERCYRDYLPQVTIDWPPGRLQEPLGFLLQENMDHLLKLRGFGRKKIAQTFANLRAIAIHLGWAPGSDLQPQVGAVLESKEFSLAQYGLPDTFPVEATFLSQRACNYCAAAGIVTLVDLTAAVTSPGWETSVLKYANMGRKSVGEIHQLVAALNSGDRTTINEFIPLRSQGKGLDYGGAAEREAQGHLPVGLAGLERRLVQGQTLEQVAIECAVTRERVRQIERLLLERIAGLLAAAPADRSGFWHDWVKKGTLLTVGSDCGAAADQLAAAVITKLFTDSAEGQALLVEAESACKNCHEALILERTFYSGELRLADFIQGLPTPPEMSRLLEWNQRQQAFRYDAATGLVVANAPRTKQIVRALLTQRDMPAAEILDFLHRGKFEQNWTTSELRRHYLCWCEDADAPKCKIIFPTSGALKSRRDLIAQLVRARSQTQTPVARPEVRLRASESLGPDYQRLVLLDQRLQSILAASPDAQSLFGLLPVNQELQDEAIKVLKMVVLRKIERLLQCLQRLPCVAGYVLVIGPGSTMEGQAFFEPLEQYLEFPILPARRNELTEAFKVAARQLGLLPIPSRERTDNVGPFVFQAAIILRFVDLLVPAIVKELSKGISPDITDEEELGRFAQRVAGYIHPSQVRLRKVLDGDAGIAVCRVLLRAYQTGDFAQLPPHLSKRCAEAFQNVGRQNRDFLKSPYSYFDSDTTELYLVLPCQPLRLVRSDTMWRVGSSRQFSVQDETRIPVAEEPDPSVKVEMAPLASAHAHHWSQDIELVPTERQPVWIFDAATGRRVQYHAQDEDGIETLRLPGGRDFHLVTIATVTSDVAREDWRKSSAGLQTLRYESFWGQVDLVLSLPGERSLRVASRHEPSILIAPIKGGHLQSNEGESVLFGSEVQLTLIAPPGTDEATAEPLRLRIPSAGQKEAVGPEDALRRFFTDYCATLAEGIHRVEVEFAAHGKIARRGFYFWKGLSYLDYDFGFCCTQAPKNIDWANSHGIAEDRRGVRLMSRWSEPEVSFALQAPSVVLRIKRPGVTVALQKPATGFEEFCELNQLVHVPKHDSRRIIIRLEATGSWEVQAGKSVIARTEDGSMRKIFRLDDLIPEGSNSVTLRARSGSVVISLLRLQRQFAVTGLRVVADEIEDRYYVRFAVPWSLKNIALVRTSLLPDTKPGAGEATTAIAIAPDMEMRAVTGLAETYLRTKTDGESGVLVELFSPYAALQGTWHKLELRYQDEPSADWNELFVADANGAYGSRWIFSPPATSSLSDDFVVAMLQVAKSRSDAKSAKLADPVLPAQDKLLHDAFEVLEALLDYHYSMAGWESARWASEGFFWLCHRAQEGRRSVLAHRAVAGLALSARQTGVNYRPLHFGSSELACSFPGQCFDLPSYPQGIVGDCFRLVGRRARHDSLSAALAEALAGNSPKIALWPFFHFANSGAVFAQKAEHFLNLQVNDLLQDLNDRITNYDPHSQDSAASAALADRSWAEAHRSVEKRLIQLHATAKERPGRLNDIAAFGQRMRHLQSALRKVIRPQAGDDLEWTDLTGDETTRTNLQLVFWIAALGRATAHGWFTAEEYVSILGQVFSGSVEERRPIRKGLSLCLGLAPEWFALAMLLWDLMLSDSQGLGNKGSTT